MFIAISLEDFPSAWEFRRPSRRRTFAGNETLLSVVVVTASGELVNSFSRVHAACPAGLLDQPFTAGYEVLSTGEGA